jgi:predicted ATPase
LRQYAPLWLAQMPSLIQPTEREGLQHQLMGSTPERMLREIAQAVETLTVERPLVLVLEDLHWSDYSTLAFISFLARRRESARLMIVGTYRPVEVLANDHPLRAVTQELQMHRQSEELALGFLTKEDVTEYLAVRFRRAPSPLAGKGQDGEALRQERSRRPPLPNPLPRGERETTPSTMSLPALAQAIHHRTEGNPLFMVTVVDDLLVQENLDSHVAEIHAPATIRQMIERQFDRLSSHEQQLLEVASVVGVEFSAAAVAVDAEPTVAAVEASCAVLARRGQFVRASGAVEWPLGTVAARFSFLHALYQAVIYERVTAGRRTLLHQQIGERLEAAYGKRAEEIAAELAVHFAEGRDYPRAVHYLKHAGENALRRNAHREATLHFMRGLKLLTTLPDTLERAQQELVLQAALGEALMVTKGFAAPEAERAYARAWELCQRVGETPQLFPVLSGLRLFHMARAEWQSARELGEQLLRLAQKVQDPALLLGAHHAMGDTVYLQGELTRARMHQEHAIALYHPEQHHALAFGQGYDLGVDALAHGAWILWYLGYPEQALQRSHAALALARKLSHTYSVAHALWCAAWLHQLRREAYATQEQAEATIALATEHGFAGELLWATIHRGWALVEQGREEEGIAQMHQGLTALHTTGADVFRPGWLAVLAEAYAKVGRAEKGLGLLTEALALTERNGERLHEAELYRIKGALTLQKFQVSSFEFQVQISQKAKVKGQKAKMSNPQPLTPNTQGEAEACFHKAIEVARKQQVKSLELRAVLSLSRLWQQQGKQKQARQMLAAMYGWFTEGFDTKDLQEAKALLVSLASRV